MANSELEVLVNGVILEVVKKGVTNSDTWLWISDSSGIMSDTVRDLVGTNFNSDDLY